MWDSTDPVTNLYHTPKVVSNHWTGLLDWNTGMDYWTDIFFGFTHFKGGVTVHLGDL